MLLPAANMNGVNKWPLRKVGKAICVLSFENERTMGDILRAVVTIRQRSKEKQMEEDSSVLAHQ